MTARPINCQQFTVVIHVSANGQRAGQTGKGLRITERGIDGPGIVAGANDSGI